MTQATSLSHGQAEMSILEAPGSGLEGLDSRLWESPGVRGAQAHLTWTTSNMGLQPGQTFSY